MYIILQKDQDWYMESGPKEGSIIPHVSNMIILSYNPPLCMSGV